MCPELINPARKAELKSHINALLAPAYNANCDNKIKSAWPQILNIKESLIKYVFESNERRGGKVRGGASKRKFFARKNVAIIFLPIQHSKNKHKDKPQLCKNCFNYFL